MSKTHQNSVIVIENRLENRRGMEIRLEGWEIIRGFRDFVFVL